MNNSITQQTTVKPLPATFDFESARDYVHYHGKTVKLAGNSWRITAVCFGPGTKASVECFFGPDKGKSIDLISARTPLSRDIRNRIKMNLVS